MVLLSIQMVQFIKVDGKVECNMEKGLKLGPMEQITTANIAKVKKKGVVSTHGQMVQNLLVNGKIM